MMSHHEMQEQSRLLEMYLKQKAGEPVGEFPNGKISEHDEGALAFKLAGNAESGVVVIDFGKPVRSIAFEPQEAIQLAQLLIQQARGIAKSPIHVVIN